MLIGLIGTYVTYLYICVNCQGMIAEMELFCKRSAREGIHLGVANE